MALVSSDKKRVIRSFVVRSGRMTVGQQRGWEQYWDKLGLEFSAQKVDVATLFDKAQPLVLEIGFGMGDSLFEMASANPNLNFIGVEVHRPGVGAILAKAGDAELNNLKVMCCDAVEFIDKMLPDESVSRLQLYFPDPWHKKRHHKRRLVQPEFVSNILPKLSQGGVLHMATDWQPYAEHMLEVLEASSELKNQAGKGAFSEKPEFRPSTKFEKRGLKLGHSVWDLLFEKL